MNTTNTTHVMPAYTEIAAADINVGDVYSHGSGDKLVTSLELTQDGYLSIRWNGGVTMCEADAPVLIRTN